MLDVKYEGLQGTCLITAPLNRTSNLSEYNISHGGIAQRTYSPTFTYMLQCEVCTFIEYVCMM